MKTKDKISLVFTGTIVVCALIITGLVLRREFFPPESQQKIHRIDSWQQLEFNGYQTGPKDAPVQLIEFFDYECPFCKQVQPRVKKIRQKYAPQLSVIHEHFPLVGHEHAFEAAVAAECAGRQDLFEPYHELLFAHQDRLGQISYDSLAAEAGVGDSSVFSQCVENEETADIIESGKTLAEKLDISGIPAFLINGVLVSGALSEQQLEGMIQEALSETKEIE